MSEEAPAKAIQVKLVLLGEAAVGKSSLVLRFVSNDFNEHNSPTIGAAFLTQKCRLEDKVIKFEIWDTAGQERFHSLAPMYYRNAAAAVVVYDITKASSLEKAKAWVNELQRQANPNIVIALVGNKLDLITDSATSPTSPFISNPNGEGENSTEAETAGEEGTEEAKETPAVATPTSAGASLRQVSSEEAAAYAKEAGGLLFFEASAKTGKGVQELFTEIAKNLPMDSMQPKTPTSGNSANSRRAGAAALSNDGGRVNLGEGGIGSKVKGGCC